MRSLGWQSVFWAGVPLGLVALVAAAVLLRESRSESATALDPIGHALLALFLLAVAFTLIEGAHLGWTSGAVLAAGVLVVVALVVLVRFERRRPSALIPFALFTNRPFATAITTAVLGYQALAGLLFVNTFYLQSARGLDPMSAGLLTIPLALGATVSARLSGSLVAKGYSRRVLVVSGTLIAIASVALLLTERAPLPWVIVPYLVFGAGFGFIADPISVTALSQLSRSQAGLASSLVSTSKQVGQMLGIAVVGTLLALHGGSNSASNFASMGAWVWALLGACGLAIALLNALPVRSRDVRSCPPQRDAGTFVGCGETVRRRRK